jgi:hypothetical protein
MTISDDAITQNTSLTCIKQSRLFTQDKNINNIRLETQINQFDDNDISNFLANVNE